ncbi:MAG: DUF333 domain-containing protein [Candidatus Diapherotrites archaeon]
MNLRYLSLTFFLILIVSVAFANIGWLQNSNNFNIFQPNEINEIKITVENAEETAEEPETFVKTAVELPTVLELSQDDVKDELVGMANPATIYCTELGHRHKIIEIPEGQIGICTFPNGEECEEWEFYAGTCGAEFNYCAQNGYETLTMTDGQNPFSKDYTVCVRRNKIIGSVSDLMNLSDKLTSGCETEITAPLSKPKDLFKIVGNGVVK